MIDALLRVLDRVIDLRRYQSDRLAKQYDVFVKPIVEDLEAVHGDYRQMFTNVRQQMVAGTVGPSEAADLLEQRRVVFEPAREKLIAAALSFRGTKFAAPIEKFWSALLVYFPLGDLGIVGGTAATSLILELRRLSGRTGEKRVGALPRWIYPSEPPIDRELERGIRSWGSDGVACIDWFLESQRRRWRWLCDAAAEVQASVAGAD